ncbi:MAG: class I SAM-dependent methyltransferase [Pseudolabrys sp.]
MPQTRDVELSSVKAFWDQNPVAAAAIDADRGTAEYFTAFDALRESEDCEPYAFSDFIHGYSSAAGLKVLDVGCGNGYVLAHYARNGAEVCGVDITPTAVRLSQRRFELAGLNGRFDMIDGQRLPHPDATFDIVCSMGVLHHISNPAPLVDEIHRVLKPGGQLIAMLYHRHSWKNLVLLRLLRYLHPVYRGKTQQQALNMNDGVDCPLALVYSRREAARLFGRFRDFRFDLNQLTWQQLFIVKPVARLAARLFGSPNRSLPARVLGWSLYIRAVKPFGVNTR